MCVVDLQMINAFLVRLETRGWFTGAVSGPELHVLEGALWIKDSDVASGPLIFGV